MCQKQVNRIILNNNTFIKIQTHTKPSMLLSNCHNNNKSLYLFSSLIRTHLLQQFASKKANYASQPIHPQTTSMWQYDKDGKTPQKLKIATWNVNGIRAIIKKDNLQQYMIKSDPDILCINQTKIDLQAYNKDVKGLKNMFETGDDQDKGKKNKQKDSGNNNKQDNSKFGSWYHYWNFCKVSSGYSGVLTFSKYKPIKCMEDFAIDHHFKLQGRCLTSQYQKFFLVNLYKPNSGSNLQRLEQRTQIYQKKLTQYINYLQSLKKPVILCGDMNVAHKQIDLARPKTNTKNAGFTPEQRNAYNNFIKQTKMIDSFRKLHPQEIAYTWWSTRARARESNVGWRIDYIFVSQNNYIGNKQQQNKGGKIEGNNKNIEIKNKFGIQIQKVDIRDDVMGSDHCPVQAEIKLIKL